MPPETVAAASAALDNNLPIALNPNVRPEARRVGREGHPLLIMDEVLSEPETLVAAALRAPFGPGERQYPGLNAPVPDTYYRTLVPALRPMLKEVFGIAREARVGAVCRFGLATQTPDQLKPMQKIPHTDSNDPFCIALVHYLCRGQKGGTALFRHRATGFEGVDAGRRSAYAAAALAELEAVGEGLTRHVNGETPYYELIDFAELRFNRLVAYRSHVLHSGMLEEAELDSDPARGRLTVTSLVKVLE
jgi:hypothetical protein